MRGGRKMDMEGQGASEWESTQPRIDVSDDTLLYDNDECL